MEELNKMLGVDVNKSTINLLIDNRTDILINQEMLVQILSHLESRDKNEIYHNIETKRGELRQSIVDDLPKLMVKR